MAKPEKTTDFEAEAGRGRTNLLVEFLVFLMHNKKWWMVPILIVLCMVGLLVALGTTSLAPFIYALF